MALPGVGSHPSEIREFDVELRVQIDDDMSPRGGAEVAEPEHPICAGTSEIEYEFNNQKYKIPHLWWD